jgi:hypothetical protein
MQNRSSGEAEAVWSQVPMMRATNASEDVPSEGPSLN